MTAAMARVLPRELAGRDPLVRPSEHADFQSNAAMALAGPAGLASRELAERLRQLLAEETAFTVSVAGPGFLNLTVPDALLWGQVEQRLADPRLGAGLPLAGSRVVVDYSGPNIAKEMHVGHLRSNVIGDALARSLSFLGADVIRQNHLGDWGTQFGMLIQYLTEHPEHPWRDGAAGTRISLLDALYKTSRQAFEADPEFAERSRRRVVALQGGDPATVAVWQELVEVSGEAFQQLYDRLGLLITPQDTDSESSYNEELPGLAEELIEAGIAVESAGALCVFFEDILGPEGAPVPLIVRKQDGGFGYQASDLATLRHRVRDLGADRILYVVDARQALHFKMVFAAARRAGWLPAGVEAKHVPFGTVMGPGGKPFKTRSGGTVRLAGLLDSAVDGVRAVMAEKSHELSGAELERVAEAAGIGAVKYADLSTSWARNYVFDIDQMVSLNGDTGVYLLYAHARVRSILAKAGEASVVVDRSLPLHPAERALVLLLDGFEGTVREVARELEPHRLCGYLFALAKAFTEFYGACPVLKAPTPGLRGNRLALCELTAATLARGLDLLGLEAPERI
ncbi:arginine--tRNA ligase [Kitasatospora viridis]|uniref:Arginine--tRNA ligase n=2 Tax=Kitasatospora viridis TaxID=281105 RepID=A0A561ULC1_9ACTN|nr:arginine--tRNA ligase [Kitasatospora viridis]TWG00160.1 arginyl-tRNA synthetase [Kitasatospora viridis]